MDESSANKKAAASPELAKRLAWEVPELTVLPALSELTLQTGGGIGGGGRGSGTVF